MQYRVDEPIRRICSWCDRTISGPEDAANVSHGICQECKAELTAEYHLAPVAAGEEDIHVG